MPHFTAPVDDAEFLLHDAPAGVKGISLFIRPKYVVDEGGNIEEKMGLHGNATCVMNEARVSTALQDVSLGEGAYQAPRDYALDRLHGRDVASAKAPEGPADTLVSLLTPEMKGLLPDIGFDMTAEEF